MAMEDDVKGPRDYLAAMLRRKWRLIVPAILISIIAALVAVSIPAAYKSTGTVLIEEPEVPRELVQSTITSFAAQRLQVIQQRVMTTQNLINIINKFDLYRQRRLREPISEIASNFRGKISMELVSAEVIDPRSGRSMEATIAFNVSFEDTSRRVAQQVANELVSLYLNENLRDRREKAAETTGFLADEAARLGELVSDVESRLAEFKLRNAGQLPGQLDVNLGLIRRAELELQEAGRRLHLLEQRKLALQAELAQLSPYGARVVDGQTVLSPPERLRALQIKYISMKGAYGAMHPDVLRMQREIDVLKKETGAGADVEGLKRQLQTTEDSIDAARKKYGAKHPDVVTLERQAKSLRAAIKGADEQPNNGAFAPNADNPAYLLAQSQLKSIDAEMFVLQRQKEEVRRRIEASEARVLKAPEAEREYLMLKRDYENAYAKYKEIKAKQLEAQLAQALETERKSERFSLIEPPQLPLKPESPNRIAIVFIGIMLAGAAGVGNVFLAESLDESVYGSKQLAALTGQQPLAVVPVIAEKKSGKLRFWLLFALPVFATVCVFGVLYAYHINVRPLDVMWFGLLGRFGLV